MSTLALEVFAQSLAPVGDCLDRPVAEALLKLTPSEQAQARAAELAEKCNEGALSLDERSEYEALVWADHFFAILQLKARQFLRQASAL